MALKLNANLFCSFLDMVQMRRCYCGFKLEGLADKVIDLQNESIYFFASRRFVFIQYRYPFLLLIAFVHLLTHVRRCNRASLCIIGGLNLGAIHTHLRWGHINLVNSLPHAWKSPVIYLLLLADRSMVNCVAIVEIDRMIFHKTLNLVQLFGFFAASISKSRLLPGPFTP